MADQTMKKAIRDAIAPVLVDWGPDYVERLAQAAYAITSKRDWQPIETAAIGEMVLAWCPKHRLVLLQRNDDRQSETWGISPSGRMDCPEPTHWMPLPAPPPNQRSDT